MYRARPTEPKSARSAPGPRPQLSKRARHGQARVCGLDAFDYTYKVWLEAQGDGVARPVRLCHVPGALKRWPEQPSGPLTRAAAQRDCRTPSTTARVLNEVHGDYITCQTRGRGGESTHSRTWAPIPPLEARLRVLWVLWNRGPACHLLWPSGLLCVETDFQVAPLYVRSCLAAWTGRTPMAVPLSA